MATIMINDLPASYALDRKAMARVQGAGAQWLYGWMRVPVELSALRPTQINFYQINNFAEQMINQFQNVSVTNSAPNSNVNVAVDAGSVNNRLI
jgi:hypothetical protein